MRHAAKVDRSARLRKVVEVLKRADHPLSSEEIAVRAYDFGMSKRVMMNVSTAIGEVRAEVNRNAGYFVSEARAWKSSRYPWHDGRPRYWILSAPGWKPAWTITAEGDLVPCGRKSEEAAAACAPAEGPGTTERACKNPQCGKPLPADDPLSWFCNDDCRSQWREGLFSRRNQAGPQGTLF